MSDVSFPCMESQGCHLIPLYYLLSCSSVWSCYSFCRIFLLPVGPFSGTFSRKFFQYFLRDRLFLYGSCLAARRSELVRGLCIMLPYGAGICCFAFIQHFLMLPSILVLYFLKIWY